MKVTELLAKLEREIEDAKEKYCENCQEWDCDLCWIEIDGGENDE